MTRQFCAFVPVALLGILSPLSAPHAGEPPSSVRLRSPIGTALVRQDKAWATPSLYDSIPFGTPVVALPGARAVLDASEGDLRLTLAGALPPASATPALECAITLHPAKDRDLDCTLHRGRVLLENKKEKGAVQARVRSHGQQVDIQLLEPGSLAACELISSWPVGTPFRKQPDKDLAPQLDRYVLVLKGKVEVGVGGERSTVPAPALFRWTTLGKLQGPFSVKVPAWVQSAGDQSEKSRSLLAAVEKLRRLVADLGARPGVAKALQNDDPRLRAVAGLSAFALDDPAAGVAALADNKSPEVRSAATAGALHYSGRGVTEDVALYQAFLGQRLKEAQAAIAMELLHGLPPQARNRPETYETLLAYLQSDQIIIRELAHWTLTRLIPQGKDISFDAAADPDLRAQAQAAWRKLLPK